MSNTVKLDEELPPLKKFVLVFSREHRWQVACRQWEDKPRLFRTAAEGYLLHDVEVWCETPPDPIPTFSVGTVGDVSDAAHTVIASLTVAASLELVDL